MLLSGGRLLNFCPVVSGRIQLVNRDFVIDVGIGDVPLDIDRTRSVWDVSRGFCQDFPDFRCDTIRKVPH